MTQRWHEISPGTSASPVASLVWRKSSHSDNAGNCVEVAGGLTWRVAVRDSKNPGGPALVFARGTWATFIAQVRRGEFASS
jgi:Domain of unknown function (DUF397)